MGYKCRFCEYITGNTDDLLDKRLIEMHVGSEHFERIAKRT